MNFYSNAVSNLQNLDEEEVVRYQAPQPQNITQYYVPMSVEDSQNFLLGFARDMYVDLQYKMENLHRLGRTHQRSMSDILDYQRRGFVQFAVN
jgi:hypothetical protein